MSLIREFDHLKIPLEVIKQATNNFAVETKIGRNYFGKVFKGELLGPEGYVTVSIRRLAGDIDRSIFNHVLPLSRSRHKNIVSLVGFCDESPELFFVHEFPSRGSLDKYLNSEKLSWLKRLQICVDVATGLNFLHNPPETERRVLVLDMKSVNILLDENWQAKIVVFPLRKTHRSTDQVFTMQVSNNVGTIGYLDPEFVMTGILTKESDIYSFGVVLFEVLCGRLAVKDLRDRKYLHVLVKEHYENGTIEEIIDPIIRKQMDPSSLDAFSTIAYQCLARERSERPTTLQVVEKLNEVLVLQQEFEKASAIEQDTKDLQQCKIPLEEIQVATNGFHVDNLIGVGGFGRVYKAEIFHFDVKNNELNPNLPMLEQSHYPRRKSKVAIKKLDSRYGQGREQFLQELKVLYGLQHHNLVSLLGFCDEDGDMIIIYEHAPNGSLDRCIRNTRRVHNLSWKQRLQICLDVGYGLSYLHDNGIIHRDIKSANILLGQNWEGMIGDFGLSRISKHPNHDYSLTNVAGTPAYVDPKYARTGKLTKRSDIYSLGVVLLEVAYGRLAVLPKYGDDPEYLVHMFRRHFLEKTVHHNIDPSLVEEFQKSPEGTKNFMDSINTFAAITYKCLHDNQAHHLTMAEVMKELNEAWIFHDTTVEIHDGSSLKRTKSKH